MKFVRNALLLWLAVLAAGCTVGPDYAPPQAETPPGWTKTAVPAGSKVDASPADEGAWWARFGDPVLNSLMERAQAANLDLREAALRIAEARTQVKIANAGLEPTVDGNASYQLQRFSDTTLTGSLYNSSGSLGIPGLKLPSYPNPYSQFQLGFDASWEPDLFGGVHRSIEASQADAEAAVEDAHEALVSLEGEVARSYIDLRGAQLKLAVVNGNIATAREALALARERHAAGLVTDLDVTNASAQVTGTEADIPALKRQIVLDINQLSMLLAREPGALQGELEKKAPVPSVASDIAVGLPGDLLRRRPDIRAAEARLHAATARIGVATADLFPSLTLGLSGGSQSEQMLDLTKWASRFFSLGPTLNIPVFEGGKLRANVHLAQTQEKEAAVEYAKAVLGAVHEVEDALVTYETELDRRRALEATERQNRDALGLAQQRYRSGVTTFIDVLDAERTLNQTQSSLADSTALVSTDLVAIYKALGGGWKPKAATAS